MEMSGVHELAIEEASSSVRTQPAILGARKVSGSACWPARCMLHHGSPRLQAAGGPRSNRFWHIEAMAEATMTKMRGSCIACLLGFCCGTSLAATGRFGKYPHETATDPTRTYLPGKYYERVALEDLRHKDYTGALNACQRAAYWGNKVAQYNLGQIYLHGMGRIGADPARGVAWLGLADAEHQPDYDKVLVAAYKALKPEERARVDTTWTRIQATYADRLTLARATRAFEDAHHSGRLGSATTEGDPNTYSFAIDGCDPSGDIQDAAEPVSYLHGPGVRNGAVALAGYWRARKKEFAQFVTTQFGHVEIGPVRQVAPANSKPAQ
jgi:hypothetical protein